MAQKIILPLLLVASFILTCFLGVFVFSRGYASLPESPNQVLDRFKLFNPLGKPKAYIIYSGSMEPAIKTGSVAFTIPQKDYFPGDIITFKQNSKTPVTHRVDFKLYPEGPEKGTIYLTSGDANDNLDNFQVQNEQIIGKVFLSIPYIGHAANFAKKPQGFILLVIIPATIVIYEELKALLRESKRYFKGFKRFTFRKNRKALDRDVELDDIKTEVASSGLPKASIIIPAVGAFLVVVATSASYFWDKEHSIENVLGAAVSYGEDLTTATTTPEPTITTTPTPTPTPTQNDLRINEPTPLNENENSQN